MVACCFGRDSHIIGCALVARIHGEWLFFFYIWKDEILWAKSPVFIHVKKKREMGEVVSSKKLP